MYDNSNPEYRLWENVLIANNYKLPSQRTKLFDFILDGFFFLQRKSLRLSTIWSSFDLSGIARGCGWQHIGAYINLGAFYLFGIPLAVILGFPLHIGGKGLWIGNLCGSTMQSVLLSLITGFTNWQQQVCYSLYQPWPLLNG